MLGHKGVAVLSPELAPSCPWRLGRGRVAVTPRAKLTQCWDLADALGLSREKSDRNRKNSAVKVGSNFIKGTKWNL